MSADRLQCDGVQGCAADVTHIGRKGYAYCSTHAAWRRGVEVTRKLKQWEIARLETGHPLIGWMVTRAATAEHDAQYGALRLT